MTHNFQFAERFLPHLSGISVKPFSAALCRLQVLCNFLTLTLSCPVWNLLLNTVDEERSLLKSCSPRMRSPAFFSLLPGEVWSKILTGKLFMGFSTQLRKDICKQGWYLHKVHQILTKIFIFLRCTQTGGLLQQ